MPLFEQFLVLIVFLCIAAIVGSILTAATLAWQKNFGTLFERCAIVGVTALLLLFITGLTGSLLYG